MKRRKRIFPTREAYQEWLESREATERKLREIAARISAELEAKRRPA